MINHDRAIPSTIDSASVAKIEKKRAAYKIKKATTSSSVNAMLPDWDSDEELSFLERLERDPTYQQSRLVGSQQ